MWYQLIFEAGTVGLPGRRSQPSCLRYLGDQLGVSQLSRAEEPSGQL
jgi:hypothetical protein